MRSTLVLSLWASMAAQATLPARHVDTLIDGGQLPLDLVDDGGGFADGGLDGPWRGVSMEARWSLDSASPARQGQGRQARVQGFYDADNWGLLEVSMHGRQHAASASAGITLRQRDMPLTTDWRVGHELGDVLLPVLDLSVAQPRLGLPTAAAFGAVARWDRPTDHQQWVAAVGELRPDTGWPSTQAASQRSPVALFGLEQVRTAWRHGTMSFVQGSTADSPQRWGVYHAARFDHGNGQGQAQLLGSQSSTQAVAWSGWADADTRWQGQHLGAGLRSVGDGAGWLGMPLPEGRGGYLRWRYDTPRFSASAEWDVQHSKHGRRDWQWLHGAMRTDSSVWSSQWLRQGGTGGSSTSLMLAHDTQQTHGSGTQGASTAQWRHYLLAETSPSSGKPQVLYGSDVAKELLLGRWHASLILPLYRGSRLSGTSAGSWPNDGSVQRGWSLEGGFATGLGATLTAALAAQAFQNLGTARASTSWNASATWRFARGWSLQAHWTTQRIDNVAQHPTGGPPLMPPIASGASTASVQRHAISIGLQYDWQAGRPAGNHRLGTGTTHGTAFYDANRNGRFDAGERAAAGISLVINGRYAVRTDDAGRYSVVLPVSDSLQLRVSPEGLPLPWSAPQEVMTFSLAPREERRLDVALVSS